MDKTAPSVSINTGDPSPAFEIVSIASFGISCLVVAYRIYARIRAKRKRYVKGGVGADEYFAITALILAGGVTAQIVVAVRYGINEKRNEQDIYEIGHQLKNFFAFVIICSFCLWFLKMSVLMLYLRMTPLRKHRWTIYGLMALLSAHLTVAIIGTIFRCRPISSNWNVAVFQRGPTECINHLTFDIFNSALNAFWDLLICLLPIPVIYGLKASRGKKVGLYVVVAISGLSIICAIMRLAALILVAHVKPEDVSWNSPVVPFVSVLEVCIALITSSVPAIYPLACRSRFFSCWGSRKSDQQRLSEEAWGSNVDTLTYSSDLTAINGSHGSNHPKWFRLKWGRSKSKSTVAPIMMEDIPMTDIRHTIKSRPKLIFQDNNALSKPPPTLAGCPQQSQFEKQNSRGYYKY